MTEDGHLTEDTSIEFVAYPAASSDPRWEIQCRVTAE